MVFRSIKSKKWFVRRENLGRVKKFGGRLKKGREKISGICKKNFEHPKNLGVSKEKGRQKNLGAYGQEMSTLDISRRYID